MADSHTNVDSVCADDKICVDDLAVLQRNRSLNRIASDDTGSEYQFCRLTHAFWASRKPLELLVDVHSVAEEPALLHRHIKIVFKLETNLPGVCCMTAPKARRQTRSELS